MRSFAGIATFPFRPPVSPQPLWRGRPAAYPPTVVKCVITWATYFALAGNAPNVAVLLTLTAQKGSNQLPLDDLKSVYVDNTGSAVPIYLLFPSTGWVVDVAPNTSGWFPVFTTDYIVQINALGLTTNNIPTTGIWFANILMQAYTDPEISQTQVQNLASSTITRGSTIYNTNLGIPALGDQFIEVSVSALANVSQTVFNFGFVNGFIYITCMSLTLSAVIGAGGLNSNVFFESTGISGVFFQTGILVGSAITLVNAPVLPPTAGQFKIDASQTWRLRNVLQGGGGTSGIWSINLSFTTNPN